MQLILVELNELNFDYVKKYFDKINIKTIEKISRDIKLTSSENSYHLLEPWIQWESIHTGCKATEHKIFRLGDSIMSNKKQIFKELDEKGFKVGSISAMNSVNNLKNSSYFIPDPWTDTESDKSFFSQLITKILRETVNNNASGKFSKLNYLFLVIVFFKFVRFKKYLSFIKIFYNSFFDKWLKALFLDKLIHEIHLSLFTQKNPNFTCVFFNGAAHIQHHYLLNSLANNGGFKNPVSVLKKTKDPFKEALKIYNDIMEDYLALDKNIIIATGLTQKINEKIDYYYRLTNHKNFLQEFKIDFQDVQPRMSRDFLILFSDNSKRDAAYNKLNNVELNNKKLFGVLDKRSNSLFVTLTYNDEIKKNDQVIIEKNKKNIFNEVTFVALKNGYHHGKGYLYLKGSIEEYFKNEKEIKIFDIKNKIINFFSFN